MEVTAALTVTDAIRRADEFDAVYFAGKPPQAGANEFARGGEQAAAARQLIEAVQRRGRIVAGLCRGTIVLSNSGVLNGRRAALGIHIRNEEIGGDAGIDWDRRDPVVRDGTVLTGANPGDAKALAQELLAMLRQ
jgi:putative intracellular protease/amidase